ncbi:hypothetical protein GCM10020331_097120 [Ectobacillus funiculus]
MKLQSISWISADIYLEKLKLLNVKEDKNISETEMDTFAIMLTYESGIISNLVTYAHAGWSFPF